jgi:hypothetical protein
VTAVLFGGLWYGVGALIIFGVALFCGVVGRYLKETKPERQTDEAEARELITKNAERAGWGEPERPLFSRRNPHS